MENCIFLHEINSSLHYNNEDLLSKAPGSRILIIKSNGSTYSLVLDERFNELAFPDTNTIEYIKIQSYFLKIFNDIKKSDFRFNTKIGFESTLKITLEQFINFIKTEARTSTIEKLLL